MRDVIKIFTDLNKNKLLRILALLVLVFVFLTAFLWLLFAYFKFDYGKRLWVDDLITEVATRNVFIPAYLFPYPRYRVADRSGGNYYFARVAAFENETEGNGTDESERITSSFAVLRTLDKKEERINVLDPEIDFNYLTNGQGLFLDSFEAGSSLSVAGKSLLTKKPLALHGKNLRFNLRTGDFIKVAVDDSGKKEVTWYGSERLFY
jgi:hypothetical protein